LEEKNHQQQHKSNKDIDPFSRLMFGRRIPRETHKERDNHSQETPEHNEEESFHTRTRPRTNHYDDWLFGRRREEPASDHKHNQHQSQNNQTQLEKIINNIDIGLLMETFGTIVETTKQYKPIIKEIAPFFSKFTNKFKK
jgi:hypothetical protein